MSFTSNLLNQRQKELIEVHLEGIMDHFDLYIEANKKNSSHLDPKIDRDLEFVLGQLKPIMKSQLSAPKVVELLDKIEVLRSLTHDSTLNLKDESKTGPRCV